MADAWVIDTSSITEVRRSVQREQQQAVFAALTRLVEDGVLLFPPQVLEELERWTRPDAQDLPYRWATANGARAGRHGRLLAEARAILETVPDVLDPEKEGIDEADPYVLALARQLQAEGYSVIVLTEEQHDRPDKMSLATACGILRLVRLRMRAFLRSARYLATSSEIGLVQMLERLDPRRT